MNLNCAGGAAVFAFCFLLSSMAFAQSGQNVMVPPGADLPPMTQLTEEGPVIPWDVKTVDDFQLIDQDKKPVTRKTLLGKPWIVNFVFGRCSTHCPLTSRRIMELNQELSDVDVQFVTITVDPENDTPDFLKGVSEIWKAESPRWRWLTGEPAQIWKLIREGFKVPAWENVGTARMPGMEFAHTNHLIHIDAQGRILGRYRSDTASELVTLRRVLKGQIETPKAHQPATQDQIALYQELLAGQPAGAAVEDPLAKLPEWARRLPAVNASLNGLATLLLVLGFLTVKRANFRLHKRMMIAAFVVSVAFLACYLTYHTALTVYAGSHGKSFSGPPYLKPVYLGILISHVILATTVPVLAIITIRNGLRAYPAKNDFDAFRSMLQERYDHKRWAKITFPIWLYVSVTGVVIYGMLYWL